VCYITIFAFTGRIFFFGTSFENAGVGSETEAVLHFAWDLLPLLDTTVALRKGGGGGGGATSFVSLLFYRVKRISIAIRSPSFLTVVLVSEKKSNIFNTNQI
jgi:hypothetical protein